jgi:dienelactone hydrolase
MSPAPPPPRLRRARALIALLLVGGLITACGQADGPPVDDASPSTSHLPPTLLTHKPKPTLPPIEVPTTTTPPPSRVPPRSPDDSETGSNQYAVGLTTLEFTDSTRPSAARGTDPAKSARTFVLTIRYPASGPTTAAEGQLDPARTAGPFPLVMFVHGFNSSAARYDQLLHSLSAAGYVVVAPDFPLTSSAFNGPAVEDDVVNQAGDVKFLISKMLTANDQAGVLQHLIASDKIAVAGHSDGGITAAATAYNSCCTDKRVKAVIVASGEESLFPDTWFTDASGPPFLGMHADTDEVTPYAKGQALYAAATRPKYFVTIVGANHAGPFTDGPQAPAAARLMAEFLDGQLKQDAGALTTLSNDANQAPFKLESDAS